METWSVSRPTEHGKTRARAAGRDVGRPPATLTAGFVTALFLSEDPVVELEEHA
jgi:hypothetical protein